MKNNIKIAINFDEISDNLNEAINFLCENKVKFAEIRTINQKNIVNYDLTDVKKIAKKIAINNIKISAIASPLFKWYLNPDGETIQHNNFSFDPSISEQKKKEYIKKVVEIASILGTKNIRVFSNLKQKDLKAKEIFNDRVFQYMLSEFKNSDIHPFLENEPVCLISKTQDYLKTLRRYSDKGLLAWWDIANTYDTGDRVDEDLVENLAPFLGYIHVKDKATFLGKEYVPLGEGVINYKRVLTDMTKHIPGSVYASIETHVRKNKIDATRKSLVYLNSLLHKPRVPYAMIGAGRISTNHALAFKENFNSELRGVFDINIKKATNFACRNDAKVYQNIDQLLSDPTIRIVNICTPHNTQISLAKKVIKHGKIALSEKPFAIESEKLKEYLADKNAVENTYVVFQNLFNKPVQNLLRHFKNDDFGEIQSFATDIRWCRDDNYFKDWHGKLKSSGGSLFNQAIHSIQIMLMILGEQIKDVSYQSKKLREKSEVEDIGIATIQLKNGAIGSLELCLVNKGCNLESTLYLSGTKGSIKIGGTYLNKTIYQYFGNSLKKETAEIDKTADVYGNGHVQLISTLSNKILGINDPNGKYLTKAEDVLSVTKFIEQLYGNTTKTINY
jgi:UDP-N-acetyl-2-amino-2-deoxyglucuronate dehydrogenase